MVRCTFVPSDGDNLVTRPASRCGAAWGLFCLVLAAGACGGRSAQGRDRESPLGTAGHGGEVGNTAGVGGGSAGTLGSAAATGIGGGGAGTSAGQTGATWDLNQGSAEVRRACTGYCAQLPASCLASGGCRQGCILVGNTTPGCVEEFAALIDCLRPHLDPAAACDDENCSGTTGCLEQARELCRQQEAQVSACQEACPPETDEQLGSCKISWRCDPLRVSCVAGEESWDCACSGDKPEERRVMVAFDTFTPCEDAALRCRGF